MSKIFESNVSTLEGGGEWGGAMKSSFASVFLLVLDSNVCELINSVRATTKKKKTSGPEISDSTHPPNNSLLNIIPEVKKK